MKRSSWAALLAVSFLAAGVATWPLLRHIDESVPQGTELMGTPTLHGLWSLWWAADRTAHGFKDFWNAPIFFPQRGSFTFSEPMALLGAASTPLWLSGLPPAVCYNVVLLAVLALNGVAAGRLALALGADRQAAILGAVLATTLPAVAKLTGVLTVLAFFGLLVAVEGLARFGKSGSWGAAAGAAAGFSVQCLSSEQIALMGIPLLAAAGIAALAEQGFAQLSARRLFLSFGLAGIIVLLVLLPAFQAHRELGFGRSLQEVAAGSARSRDFFTRPFSSLVGIPARESLERDTSGLFPGILLLVLGACGALSSLRSRRPLWPLLLVSVALLEAGMSLGLNVGVLGGKPFGWLRASVPGFSELRSPFRAVIITQAILAVLAALGLSALLRQFPGSLWRAMILSLGVLGAIENLCVPVLLLPVPLSANTGWSLWLREQPAGTAIVHLPFPHGDRAAAFEVETWRMFRQLDHRKPMLNGYSGYFPPVYDRFRKLIGEGLPDYRSLCALNKEAGINAVVIDRNWQLPNAGFLDDRDARRLLALAYQDEEVKIYRLAPPASDCIVVR